MAEAWKRPTFGTQVAACIAKRVALVPDPAEQRALQDWYVHWLHTKGREAQEKRIAGRPGLSWWGLRMYRRLCAEIVLRDSPWRYHTEIEAACRHLAKVLAL